MCPARACGGSFGRLVPVRRFGEIPVSQARATVNAQSASTDTSSTLHSAAGLAPRSCGACGAFGTLRGHEGLNRAFPLPQKRP
jgi:hypothetical protein